MNSRGLLLMNQRDIDRNDVIKRTCEGELKQSQAAKRLHLSTRQVKRLCRRYRLDKTAGIISKRRGKPSNRKIKDETILKIIALASSVYSRFGPTLMSEKLLERDEIKIGKEALRQLLIKEGLWKTKREKIKTTHQQRERRSCFGELVQIDGSPHDWFEGRGPKCCLIVFIDDATSELLYLCFEKAETTFGYFRGLFHMMQNYGFPLGLYSDRHGIFRVNIGDNPEAQSQFGRACDQLNIVLINANSPQAKGRVERANKTLQDRLTKELRLENISDIESANRYLEEKYRGDHNKRFAVKAREDESAFIKSTLTSEEVMKIISEQHERKVSKNLEFSFDSKTYQIQNEGKGRRLQKATVIVCETLDNEINVFYKTKKLEYKVFERTKKRPSIVDAKSLNEILDSRFKSQRVVKPSKAHPWRRAVIPKISCVV